jgi:hypothetical protein
LRVEIGQYFTQAVYADLSTIRKFQHAPTNCRLVGIVSSGYSAHLFKE